MIPEEFLELDAREITFLLVTQETVGIVRAMRYYSDMTDEPSLSMKAVEWLINQEQHVLNSTVKEIQDDIRKQLKADR